MNKQILDKLDWIESEYKVEILYACESGSRAWDFASPDSDYDVRFIYVHQPDWYLRVDKEVQRDVIELPIEGDLDINGWELQKALKLLKKSNPTLLEWIHSPIVYREANDDTCGFKQAIGKLAESYLCPRACFYHYQHMASGNYREHLKADLVKTKKYLYVLRPLLAMRWLENRQGAVPMKFTELVESMCFEVDVKQAIYELLERKVQVQESAVQSKVTVLNDFIEKELQSVEARAQALPKTLSDYDAINTFFREWIKTSEMLLIDKA
jgi:uncharacterized protein